MPKSVTKDDCRLGMNQSITRRDFVHGVSAMSLAALAPSACAKAQHYPPALTGLRGNHDGSFEVAHQLGREGRSDWAPVENAERSLYDLVVVGAGISGLAAAFFYRQQEPDAKILILDNHDDFGGHAKRNEFVVDGKKLIGYGGAQTLQEPAGYPDVVKKLLADLKVDLDRFETAFDHEFFKRNGLRAGVHFDEAVWGERKTVPFDVFYYNEYLPVAKTNQTFEEGIRQMPLSDAAKDQLVDLFSVDQVKMAEMPEDDRWEYLDTTSYRDFVSQKLNVTDPDAVKFLQDFTINSGGGFDAISALSACYYTGMPGWGATGLPPIEPIEPYIHHFPDGNASIARLLVRELVPDVAPPGDPETLLTARFRYEKLDQKKSDVRIRLNSTVVNVAHDGDASSAEQTLITYVTGGKAYRVNAKACIMACNHTIIPHLCPELPVEQREALAFQEKTPILYNTVALRNWRAFKELSLGAVVSPGGYHIDVGLDFPVSLGEYSYADDPDDPIIVHMERFPYVPGEGMPVREQNRIGRYELLTTPYEDIERSIRSQLFGILGEGGFDPAKDIAAITVNRWAHGYAYDYSSLFDERYEDWNDPRRPHMRARKRHGRITFANADAAANAMFESAVGEGHRAVEELLS